MWASYIQEVYMKDGTTSILIRIIPAGSKSFNNIRGVLDYYFNEKSNAWTAPNSGDEAMHAESRTFAMKSYLNSFDNYHLGYSLRQQDETEAEPIQRWSWSLQRKALSRKAMNSTTAFHFLNYWERSDPEVLLNLPSPTAGNLSKTSRSAPDFTQWTEYENQ